MSWFRCLVVDMRLFILLLSCYIGITGCTTAKTMLAMIQPTDRFIQHTVEPRVHYESGAEVLALIVAENLDEAVTIVERRQYSDFKYPVIVNVCANIDSFVNYCVHESLSGCVLNKRLFISPKIENIQQRLPGLIKHELSHLHMEQSMGMWAWVSDVPSWFREGLAVWVSDGAGAEMVSVDSAIEALQNGRAFYPSDTGGVYFSESASTFGLEPHMFYRQSSLLVQYLYLLDTEAFERLLIALQRGKTFKEALATNYETGIQVIWERFLMSIRVG